MSNVVFSEFRPISPEVFAVQLASLRDEDTPPAPSPTPEHSPRFAPKKEGMIQVALDRLKRDSVTSTPAPRSSPEGKPAAAGLVFEELMLPLPAVPARAHREVRALQVPNNSRSATPDLDIHQMFNNQPSYVSKMITQK